LLLPRGSQKGDIYSFGVVLYEIIGRIGPYGDLFDSSDASAEGTTEVSQNDYI
jgi:hypothetical protein